MKRALKFLLIFLAVLVLVFVVTFMPNIAALKTLINNNESLYEGSQYVDNTNSLKDLAGFIGKHPEYISIASVNTEYPDSSVFYNADTPRTMGTLSNILLLAEYERSVENGEINPDEVTGFQELDYLSLPKINNVVHKRAIAALKKLNTKQITIEQIVTVMTAENDPALSDFLWFKLGKDRLAALLASLNLEHTELPLPFSGLYISISPLLADTSRTYSDNEIIEFAMRFKNDSDFNNKVKKTINKNRLGINFMQERDALAKFPKTTAADMLALMTKLYNDELVSERVSRKIKEKMEWIYADRDLKNTLKNYGAIYDNRMGMVGGIDFGTSGFSGNSRVQAMIFDNLPVAFWLHLYSNQMLGDFQQRLIWDPVLYQTTLNEISKSE